MNWFFIALLAPACYAASNHIDKHLLSRYLQSHSITGLITVSALIGIVVLPALLLFEPPILSMPLHDILKMIFVGASGIIALFPYFHALDSDDPALVIPIFQTLPIFTYILGVVFLGETLSNREAMGMTLVIIGSVTISLDLQSERLRLKGRMLSLMLLSSFIYAAGAIVYKSVVNEFPFTVVIFWEYVGALLIGLIFIFHPYSRAETKKLLVTNPGPVLALNGLNELLHLIASLCIRFAQTLVVVALAHTALGFQPVFVLFYSFILTIFFPKILSEDFSGRVLLHKLMCISLIVIGATCIS